MSGYDRRLVEHLLPAVWDTEAAYGIRNQHTPDPDMPRGSVNPKEGSVLQAHLADIRQAWKNAPLTLEEKQAVLLRFGLDYIHEEIALLQGVKRYSAQRRVERGVGKLAAHLNGKTYIDSYEELDEAA